MILFLAFYALLILVLIRGVYLNKPGKKNLVSQEGFTVLIPFKNEVDHIQGLLNSLRHVNLKNIDLELIFISDYSQDQTENFIREHLELPYKIIENKDTPGKKTALELGVATASNPWIYTCDADCQLPPELFQTILPYLGSSDLIAGPVLSFEPSSFQGFNLLSLACYSDGTAGLGQMHTISAANLCYRKEAFMHLKPYANNKDIASGDDLFLLQAFKQNKLKTTYLSTSQNIVRTHNSPDLKSFIKQQRRWASKTSILPSFFNKLVALLIWTSNLMVVYYFTQAVLQEQWDSFFTVILTKSLIDYFYFRVYSLKIKEKICLRNYLISSLIYPFFSALLGLISLVPKKNWD
ncbi:MAG: glycosyltransferase [Flavobacteriaceae bacterium]